MAKIKQHILNNFLKSFLTLFVPFFIIMSLIYIINIAKLSAKVTLDFSDFITLYSYVLPDIIFATLPLTFIGAIINSLSNMTENNETTALFSLGYSPKKIIHYLLPTAVMFTIFTTILAIFIIPYANQKMTNYRAKKVYESKLKILPKKLSQNFGKHHIFIEENRDGKFKDVTMFTKQSDGSIQILLSKEGNINNDINSSYLNLDNGTLYKHNNKEFQIVDFKNMKLFNNSKYYSNKILNTKEFWLKHKAKFYYQLLIALSPLMLFILYISFGIFNPRYQKNLASIYILISVLLIYLPAIITRKLNNPYVLVAILILWLVISITTFNKKILKRY